MEREHSRPIPCKDLKNDTAPYLLINHSFEQLHFMTHFKIYFNSFTTKVRVSHLSSRFNTASAVELQFSTPLFDKLGFKPQHLIVVCFTFNCLAVNVLR
jgi:hypothetical protein